MLYKVGMTNFMDFTSYCGIAVWELFFYESHWLSSSIELLFILCYLSLGWQFSHFSLVAVITVIQELNCYPLLNKLRIITFAGFTYETMIWELFYYELQQTFTSYKTAVALCCMSMELQLS